MDDPEKSLESPQAAVPVATAPLDRVPMPRLSTAVTALMGLILAGGVGVLVWLEVTIPRVERIAAPEQALTLVVGRNLEVEDAITRAPAWERWLYETTTETGTTTLADSIGWYHELAEVSLNPQLHLELAILQAQAGRLDDVRAEISLWDDLDDPFPSFAWLVRTAYLQPAITPEEADAAQAMLAEALPAGWFFERMATALATKGGQSSFLTSLKEQVSAKEARLLVKVRILTAIEGSLIVAGLLALLAVLRRGLRVGDANLPPAWPGRWGIAVLIRGGALGLLVALGFLFLDTDYPFVRLISMPLAAVPVLVLADRCLLAPFDLGFGRGFGLWPIGHGGRLILAVLAVLSAGLLGEWGLGLLAERLKWSSHWTEWFDPDLVWGDPIALTISLIEFVVFAPILEELVFRGLLFGTLRRRFSWPVAATASAGMFAVAHGYGIVGLLSVFWSGLLWAWIYERTGSLLPNMLAHAVNNLLVCLSLMYLLRW